MEYHYSLTGRMLAIFVGGLILLGVLVFAAGLLVGRDWGARETSARAGELPASRGAPAPQSAPVQAPTPALTPAPPSVPSAPATVAPHPAGGAIRPADSPAAVPAGPAVSAAPAAPPASAAPPVPAVAPPAPAAPALPALPPAKSSGASEVRESAAARPSGEASGQPAVADASAAPELQGRPTGGKSEVRGYVVYAGLFENSRNAERLVEELKRRNLAAQIGSFEKPGRKPLFSVWVGPFEARSGALAVLPAIREAGVEDAMVRSLP